MGGPPPRPGLGGPMPGQGQYGPGPAGYPAGANMPPFAGNAPPGARPPVGFAQPQQGFAGHMGPPSGMARPPMGAPQQGGQFRPPGPGMQPPGAQQAPGQTGMPRTLPFAGPPAAVPGAQQQQPLVRPPSQPQAMGMGMNAPRPGPPGLGQPPAPQQGGMPTGPRPPMPGQPQQPQQQSQSPFGQTPFASQPQQPMRPDASGAPIRPVAPMQSGPGPAQPGAASAPYQQNGPMSAPPGTVQGVPYQQGAPLGAPAAAGPGAPPTAGQTAGTGAAGHRARRVYANMDTYSGGGPAGSPNAQQPQFGSPDTMQPPMPAGPSFVNPASTGYGQSGMPQMQQPMGQGQPQPGYGGVPPSSGPQFIQPAAAPQFGSQPRPADPNAQVQGLAQGFQNMGLNSSNTPGQRNLQTMNLLQRPPVVTDLDNPQPMSWMSSQFSVSQSSTASCPPSYKRCTLNAIPQTAALLSKTKIPFGLIVTPYRHLLAGEEPVPVINPPQIVRCRRCRTYINPWVQFVEQGTRWKCNMCFLTNEVPSFFDWDPETRAHVDRMKRVELTYSVVEYVAPQEYMVRPPQPVVLLFVIDVSFPAVQSGMVALAAKTILDTLDAIPNTDNRTKVGFIAVDSAIHFFNIGSNLSEPQMLVVSDLDDMFLPSPCDLLVPLTESRSVVEKLLASLGDMFKSTQNPQNALGRALQIGYKLISGIGGKIIVLQGSLPSISEGSLKPREDPKLLGTPKEVSLLQPAIGFYKSLAVDCSRNQVSIDIFLFNAQYADVATLSGCAKFTGGSVFYYPAFNASRSEDATKFQNEFRHFLSRPIGLEAVLRVRASKGIRMTAFHGNFFLRSTDLLALPNVSPDNSYAVEMSIQDNLTSSVACFQTALLHTSSTGERRIRVITLAIPVTSTYSDVFASADQLAIATLLAKKGIERALISKIEDAREAILYKLNEILAAFRSGFTSSGQSSQLMIPENLKLLPVLILGLLKNTVFRQSPIVPSDLRSYAMSLMYVYPPEMCLTSIHPCFYALHYLDPAVGLPDENDRIVLPVPMNLSSEKLERNGLYLLENGSEIYLWVGRAIAPELCQSIFDKPAYEAVIPGKTTLPQLKTEWSQRVNNIIATIREIRLRMMTAYPHVFVVKEDGDPALRMWFLSHLIEDRMDTSHSYPQFLSLVREQ
ncbi:COPII subunit, partial [Chytridiales sp. JEL 0842]